MFSADNLYPRYNKLSSLVSRVIRRVYTSSIIVRLMTKSSGNQNDARGEFEFEVKKEGQAGKGIDIKKHNT